MHPLKKILILFSSALIFCVVITACKKENNAPAITIDGFDVVDALGNFIDHVGAPDNDWTFNNTLTAAELDLFNFATTENLNNTTEATLSTKVTAYPNPTALSQTYQFSATDSVLMKIVIVDNNLKVLTKGAIKFKGIYTVTLDYADDKDLFPDGASLRVYYSFSAASKPNFKVGYGDIKMCYDSAGGGYMQCF